MRYFEVAAISASPKNAPLRFYLVFGGDVAQETKHMSSEEQARIDAQRAQDRAREDAQRAQDRANAEAQRAQDRAREDAQRAQDLRRLGG